MPVGECTEYRRALNLCMIRYKPTYVQSLGDTRAEINGHIHIAVDTNDGMGAWCTLSQLCWFEELFQDLFTNSVVMLPTFKVFLVEIFINVLLLVFCDHVESTINGILWNMPLPNTNPRGLLPSVVATLVHMTCITVARAESITSLASVTFEADCCEAMYTERF